MRWRVYFPKEWELLLLYGNAHREHLDMMGWNMQSEYGKANHILFNSEIGSRIEYGLVCGLQRQQAYFGF